MAPAPPFGTGGGFHLDGEQLRQLLYHEESGLAPKRLMESPIWFAGELLLESPGKWPRVLRERTFVAGRRVGCGLLALLHLVAFPWLADSPS